MVRIVAVEGNIGSGKSTWLNHLRTQVFVDDPHVVFVDEPVEEWKLVRDEAGHSMLEKFYAHPSKYAFAFQMMAFITRLSGFRRAVERASSVEGGAVIFTERSLFTDRHVFAQMLRDTGKMEDVEYAIYTRWFDEFAHAYPIEHVMYIKTPWEVCEQRIAQRSREGEDCIASEYLQSCQQYHDRMLSGTYPYKELTMFNGALPIYQDDQEMSKWVDHARNVVATLLARNT